MTENERMEDSIGTAGDYEGSFRATSTGSSSTADTGETRTPEEIEREIEATRSRMTRDIDAIGNKLKPSNLAHQAGDAIADRATQTGRGILDLVRENPLPAAAVGASVAWLVSRARSDTGGSRRYSGQFDAGRRSQFRGQGTDFRRRFDDEQGGKLSQAKHAVSDAASTVSEKAQELSHKAHDLTERAQDSVSELGDKAKNWTQHAGQDVGRTFSRARNELDRQTHENPLLVAAGAAVLGLAIGFLLPSTRKENELMGAARDEVADRATETVERVKDVATEGARHVADTVKAEVQNRAPEIKEMARDIGQHVKDEAKGAASEVASEAKSAARKGKSGTTGGMGDNA